MRQREYFWSLFHATEGNQLNDLRTDQVEAIFAALPKSMHREWLVWKEGSSDWRPLEEFPKILISLRQTKESATAQPPPVSQRRLKTARDIEGKTETGAGALESRTAEEKSLAGNLNHFNEPSSVIELSLDESGDGDIRNHVRYKRRFDIRIRLGHKVFQSHTIDISMTGMQLADSLPLGLPRYFQVELRAGERNVPLTCSEIRDRDGASSSRLKIESNDHMHLLQSLLLAGSP